ncbi:uncharacterized protein LOC112575598 isoform X2 [Pomacea canaliculata]|uniref:uncharacterized protein LOC112575598 isoform X2 n=1 Tax=Pomacea canaliculata TaxID=400727 RepID=UPI000D72A1F2|nr:uncharacterized protein LOC112575598 isoform X2 [Pomacea canaliculata]
MLYPKIGEQAYAVPPFQIHSSKTSETTVGTSRILQSSESESDFRGLTGQRTVGQRFRALNRTFEKSSREKCMFIIIDYVMDNFMRRFYKTNSKTSRPSLEDFFKDSITGKWWVGCPDDSDEETKSAGTRSNQDLIVLHEDKGLLFVQIKSVQKNKTTTDEAVVKSIKDGQKQLLQDVSVLKKCLRKSTPQSVTKVLALPNLRKQDLHSIKQIKGLVGKDVKLLLADHLSGDEDFGVWWEELDKKRLGSDKIKEIVGRYLGLFSTPQQLQAVNERHHVRDHCDALLFTGRLFKRLIFTQKQLKII